MTNQVRFKKLTTYKAFLTRIYKQNNEEVAETRQYKIIGDITDGIDAREFAREVGWIGKDFDSARFVIQLQYEDHWAQTWIDLQSKNKDSGITLIQHYKNKVNHLNTHIRQLQESKERLRKDLQDELISKSEDQDKFAKEREALAQQLKSQADTIADLKSRLAAQEWAGAEIGERTEARVRTLTLEKGQLDDLVKKLQSQIDVLKDVIRDNMS